MTTLNINLQKAFLIIDILLQIKPKYVWWNINMKDCGPQAYAEDNTIVDFDTIKQKGINCVGLINIIRRCLALKIPGLKKSNYAGGTYEWYKYLKKHKKLHKFNINKSYPSGTILIRKYKSETDQGHVAIIKNNNDETVLEQKLIHAYSNTILSHEYNTQKYFEPGLTIDDSVSQSHSWYLEGTYTHVCLPENWLI